VLLFGNGRMTKVGECAHTHCYKQMAESSPIAIPTDGGHVQQDVYYDDNVDFWLSTYSH